MQILEYPQLIINLKELAQNYAWVHQKCNASNIQLTGVVKGCHALLPVVTALSEAGMTSVASSRLSQLERIAQHEPDLERWLLRIAMPCEVHDVVRLAHVSLQSDLSVLCALNEAAQQASIRHKVILMIDLGDLREGVWGNDALVKLADYVEFHCPDLHLYGIGTNLGCYGSIKPNIENMTQLVASAKRVEEHIGRPLEIVSGGATTSFPLVLQNQMPAGINHLRIGEGILLARDLKDFFGLSKELSDLSSQTFIMRSQIIEINTKPSYPVGEIFVDAFGNKPEYIDRGDRLRALLTAGKQDYGDHDKLIPLLPGLQVVGSSSDHLIVDITDCDPALQLKVGDVISFELYYPAMLYLSINDDVIKIYDK